MLDLKDKNLEWELRALIKQLGCLLDNPDELCVECPAQVVELATMADALTRRTHAEIEVPRLGWGPIKDELLELLRQLDRRMTDLNLLMLIKKREFFKEMSTSHPLDEVRVQAKATVNRIESAIAMLSQQ